MVYKLFGLTCAASGRHSVAKAHECKEATFINGGNPPTWHTGAYCTEGYYRMIIGRCQQARAVEVFLFLTFTSGVLCFVLNVLRRTKEW